MLHLLPLEPAQPDPEENPHQGASGEGGTAKSLHVSVTPVGDDLARDGASDEGGDGGHAEQGTRPHADLLDVGELGDDRRQDARDAAGTETKHAAVDDGGGGTPAGDPQGQRDDGRQNRHGQQDVEAADAVGEEGWDGPAERAGGVHDGDEVLGERVGDAVGSAGEDDEGEGDEETWVTTQNVREDGSKIKTIKGGKDRVDKTYLAKSESHRWPAWRKSVRRKDVGNLLL